MWLVGRGETVLRYFISILSYQMTKNCDNLLSQFFINVYVVLFLFNNVIYVFLLYDYVYIWLPWLRFFPCFFFSCKANARVIPTKTGHGPHSSKFFCCSMHFLCCSTYFCFVLYIICLFCDVPCIVCVYMCTEQLPPGGYPIAVKYIILYHKYGQAYMSSSSGIYLITRLLIYCIYDLSVTLPFAVAQQYIRNIRCPSCRTFLSD
jgi:hypothetical protein